jgi:hypothetical protein
MDVYAIIAYYTREQAQIDAYITDLYRRADESRRHIEDQHPDDSLR